MGLTYILIKEGKHEIEAATCRFNMAKSTSEIDKAIEDINSAEVKYKNLYTLLKLREVPKNEVKKSERG